MLIVSLEDILNYTRLAIDSQNVGTNKPNFIMYQKGVLDNPECLRKYNKVANN